MNHIEKKIGAKFCTIMKSFWNFKKNYNITYVLKKNHQQKRHFGSISIDVFVLG
jgi:hypothetical protein